MSDDVDDKFKPVRPGDASDLELLPRRFDMFAAEMRDTISLLVDKLIPGMDGLRAEFASLRRDWRDMEDRYVRLDANLTAMDKRVAALEARTRRLKRARRK